MPTLTIRLDDELDATLSQLAQKSHRSKSDLVQEILHREAVWAELRRSNALLRPFAERASYLTDEDFFRAFA
jgi:predicted transcriptional regulator